MSQAEEYQRKWAQRVKYHRQRLLPWYRSRIRFPSPPYQPEDITRYIGEVRPYLETSEHYRLWGGRIGRLSVLVIAVLAILSEYRHFQRIEALEERARQIGWDLDIDQKPYSQMHLDAVEQAVEEAEFLHPKALNLSQRAEQLGWTLEIEGPPYSGEAIQALTVAVEISEKNASRAHELERKYGRLPDFPWTDARMRTFSWVNRYVDTALIPAGQLTMGCIHPNEECYFGAKPSHSVSITHDIVAMRTEVTQALYMALRTVNPSQFSGCGTDCPVEYVNWFEATSFANALSHQDGLEPCYQVLEYAVRWAQKDCTGWRLPTEAEWEYLAKGGSPYRYAGSDLAEDVAWHDASWGEGSTHPVAQKKANGFGLYDMSGNVKEWVWDWYHGYPDSAQVNPTGLESGSQRISRGGGWSSLPKHVRCSYRDAHGPAYRAGDIGFRLIRRLP